MNQIVEWALFIIMFICTIVLIYMAVQFNHDGYKCLANPIPYGITQISKANDDSNITCICSLNNAIGQSKFEATSKGIITGDIDSLNKIAINITQ